MIMGHLRKSTSLLRKAILIGWAVAVIWIYLGNLINFHQHRIWGKQLIPVACSSTRVKEKDAASFVKNNRNSILIDSGLQFDFTVPDQLVSEVPYTVIDFSPLQLSDPPVLQRGIPALSYRGPPSA